MESKKDFLKFVKSNNRKYYNTIANDVNSEIITKLLNERIIFLTTEINEYTANIIKSQLIYLNSISSKDISIYIDSPGGDVYTGLGVLDIMDFIDCDISTVNIGLAASMASVILLYGTKGKRKSLKRSRTMIHQPSAYQGYAQASDIEISAKEIIRLKDELIEIISDKTGQPFDKVKEDSDRDMWLRSNEAKDYGIIDKII